MMRSGMKAKFLIGTVGIMLCFGLALMALTSAALYKGLHDGHAKRGAFLAASIAGDSLDQVLAKRFAELQSVLRHIIAAENDIAYIIVAGNDGKIMAQASADGAVPIVHLSVMQLDDQSHLTEPEQDPVHDFSAPLGHGAFGRVHVGIRETSIDRDVNRVLLIVLAGIIAAVVIGSSLAVALAVSLTRPVEELSDAVGAMERGDLRVRVPVRSEDEAGLLAAAFNSMAESREQVEAALLAGERKLRSITASIGEGVLVVDTEGRLTFMNPEAERLLGWTEAELLGRLLHEVAHYRKPDGSRYPAQDCPSIRAAITGERVHVDDEIYFRKDGSEFPVSYISNPVMDGGKVVGVVTAFRDITLRKAREAEREMLILEHMDALSRAKVLSGMLPICSSCKRIRDDEGYWKQIESYIHDHSEAEFSHGICPECAERLYPDHFTKDA